MRETPSDIARWQSGDQWESVAGFSRAIRVGDHVAVSGTTANAPDGGALYPGDTYRQTLAALQVALDAAAALGAPRERVLRTRVMLSPAADWREASRAHADLLGSQAPANSMYVVHALIGDDYLVEVELDAVREETTR